MSQRLEKLLAIRKRIIADCEHHIVEIEKFTDASSRTVISFRNVALEKTIKDFNDLLCELDRLQAYHELPDVAELSRQNRVIQDKYLTVKALLSELVPDEQYLLNSTLYQPENIFEERSNAIINPPGSTRLPPIQLRPFDGKFEEWAGFIDMFLALMKKHRGDDVEKLSHLRNHLRSEALDVIKHLPLKNENYERAIELLRRYFENKSAIIDSHLKTFVDLSPITSSSAASLRNAITTTQGCLSAINGLEIMTETWDPFIVYVLKNKLDTKLRDKWEEERKGSHTPATLKEFIDFLSTRQRVVASIPLQKMHSAHSTQPKTIKSFVNVDKPKVSQKSSPKKEICSVCKEEHRVFMCPQLNEGSQKALELVTDKRLCTNCLYGHKVEDCKSQGTCRTCQQRHHTLLHEALSAMHQVLYVNQSRQTLLATAIVPIIHNGSTTHVRALVDQGSMINLMTNRTAQLLDCSREKGELSLFGVANTSLGVLSAKTQITIGSLYNRRFRFGIEAYITSHITSLPRIPSETFAKWPHLNGLRFADPINFKNEQIDLLIGAQTFAKIVQDGLVKGKSGGPIAQRTKLGWILSGSSNVSAQVQSNLISNDTISQQMKAFWEIEEPVLPKFQSQDEMYCEKYFQQTTTRERDGRLMVRIPFNHDPSSTDFLGESYEQAKKRFHHLEKRFAANPTLKREYSKGIEEYIELGHAIETQNVCHVIPHHAVIRESSLTTKVRAVYDASMKTSNGISLNERMHTGPVLLEEIWAVLIRWRLGKIAITSDIEKMYRQFWVHPSDAKFQQILWRSEPHMPLKLYELKTVTFGTAAAPFLAIRCLHYIADSVNETHPQISTLIKRNFYVDDLLSSFNNINEAKRSKELLTKIFTSFSLNLRKWNSNERSLAEETSVGDIIDLKLNSSSTCSILGMKWDTHTDQLSYAITLKPTQSTYSKRQILSEIASLFDPLGMLAPIIIRAKLLMQQLWLVTTGWDDKVPENICEEWKSLRQELSQCSVVQVNRWIGFTRQNKHMSIHGFADASEKGYASVIYIRTEHVDGTTHCQLLTSKTKVAPLKTMSIPRLELCAATLTANLLIKVSKSLELERANIHAWTDSAITLAWISTPPYKLKTFVANRVSEIQEKVEANRWHYVKSKQNSADHASRGMTVSECVACEQWWVGPKFLKEKEEDWPKTPIDMLPSQKLPELKTVKTRILFQKEECVNEEFAERYSSYRVLLKVAAICIRWLPKNKGFRNKEFTSKELMNARNTLIRFIQDQYFHEEINLIKGGKPLGYRSSLLSLTPFVDKNGVLRVGGRLNNSCLAEETKHPAIMPAKGYLTTLLIRHSHHRMLHGGTQLTLRAIREEYWIIRGKTIVKNELRKCITCFRTRCKPMQQQMSDLLSPQVQPNRPFSFTGVDYAGHFMVKSSMLRNAQYHKCYVSLFVCLTTKAIHLELVPNLSTEAFLMALRRFTSRRGMPNHMYSDQGTNFIGASNELPNLLLQARSEAANAVQKECANHGITWHFTPGRAAHFGGLWEAGVKSMKTHLNRCFQTTKLNNEEFSTALIQIEACLNSRPLCPISDDPEEIAALTPGHFLIGQALTALPHPDVTHIPMGRLSRFQYIQKIVQDFWRIWSHEYLARLQQRPKWKQQHKNLTVGQIVLLMEENTPPAQWNMGRVVKVFPGADKLVRCADIVKIEGKKKIVISRPIHKLCLLPIEDNCTESEERIIVNYCLARM